jgi:hypothetical protein
MCINRIFGRPGAAGDGNPGLVRVPGRGCLQLAGLFADRPYTHVLTCPVGKWFRDLQRLRR